MTLWSLNICVCPCMYWKLDFTSLVSRIEAEEHVRTKGTLVSSARTPLVTYDTKTFLKKDLLYPLDLRALKRVCVISLKSCSRVQIRQNLRSYDLTRLKYVCSGWKLFLCRRACVSVSLKKTFMSRLCDELKSGPLYVMVSKKSTDS